MLGRNERYLIESKPYWKFGKQILNHDVKILMPVYLDFLNAKTKDELIDTFLIISELFVEKRDEIRKPMTEREFAALVGFRLEEFAKRVLDMLKRKYRIKYVVDSVEGRNAKMIIYETEKEWVGQGADLAVGNWTYHNRFQNKFFEPKIIIESKRYIDLTRLRDVSILAIKWKKKYTDIKFLVFSEHNDLPSDSSKIMIEFWGEDIDDIFFIKEGSRNIEKQGINIYKREEIERYYNVVEQMFKDL